MMVYLTSTVVSPSVTLYALDLERRTYLRVTIDYDGATLGRVPFVYQEGGMFESPSQFTSTVDVPKLEFEKHYRRANSLVMQTYLNNEMRPIAADL